MAKKKEENNMNNITLDTDSINESNDYIVPTINDREVKEMEYTNSIRDNKVDEYSGTINCLRKERVIVRFIPRESNMVKNPKHVLYGKMAEASVRIFTVPMLSSGQMVNVLTDKEKDFLEEIMGLENNALSVYKKTDNFWSTATDNGISKVRLYKQDNILDLSLPDDFIKYKILLANKDFIAPSLQVLRDKPKSTYQFVIIEDNEDVKSDVLKMSKTMECYKMFGAIEGDKLKLRFIVESLSNKPTAVSSDTSFLMKLLNDFIQSNPNYTLQIMKDPLLDTKVFIKDCIEKGIIAKRGDYLYVRDDNKPLCEIGQEPTFSIAAQYLNKPKNQDLLFTLQAKLNLKND